MRNAYAEALEDSPLCVMRQPDVEGLTARQPRVALSMLDRRALAHTLDE